MCWRKRVPKRPVWPRILQVLQTHLNSVSNNKLFAEIRPFPVTIARVRKREPIQASFELQLQKEKQKQNQEATTIQKRTPRADTALASGFTRPKIRKRREKKFDQYDDMRQSARFNKEELEKMFSDEADAEHVPHTPKQIQDKINEILEQDSKGRIKYSSKPNAATATMTTSAATSEEQPIATCGEAKKGDEEAFGQEKSEEVVKFVQLDASNQALARLPICGNSEMCDPQDGATGDAVGALDAAIEESKPSESEDSPQSVRIEFEPENVLVRPEAGEKDGQENRANFRPGLDLIDSLTASDDMKDERSKSADDEEDGERELLDARARELPHARDLIKLKVAKIDKTFSGIVNLVKQSDDFDFLLQLLKFASSMKKIFDFLDDILPPIEAYKIPGVVSNDKLTRIKAVLILNFVSFIQSLRFLVVEIETTLKDDMDWIADVSKVVKLCHRKTRVFLTEAKAL